MDCSTRLGTWGFSGWGSAIGSTFISGRMAPARRCSRNRIELIPDYERLLTVEDGCELPVPHRNAVRMSYTREGAGTAKWTAKDLL